eukprot:15449332-Alexandrium_andersonii.AAC.1
MYAGPALSVGFAAPVAACGSRCPSAAACPTSAGLSRAFARRWLRGSLPSWARPAVCGGAESA